MAAIEQLNRLGTQPMRPEGAEGARRSVPRPPYGIRNLLD